MATGKTRTLTRLIKARALRQGLIGGSPIWRAVWIAQFGYKQFSKLSKGGDPPITFDEPLKEGEVWAVVHEPEKTRKGLGHGRKFLIGPKRKKPRANTMTGLALGVVGQKILEAPSPERINQILGEEVFPPPSVSRSQKRAANKQRKRQTKLDKRAAKHAKVEAAQRSHDAKRTAKQAKKHAKDAERQARQAARTARRQARAERLAARRQVRAATRAKRNAAQVTSAEPNVD